MIMFKTYRLALLFFLLALVLSGCRRNRPDLESLRYNHLTQDNLFFEGLDRYYDHPLTLEEIICIAIENNLDLMVKEQEAAISYERAGEEHWKLLPSLRSQYRYTERDRNTASFSQSLVPGVPPAPLSISRNRFINTWQAEFSYHTLNFGIAYYRWHQEGNRGLVRVLQYNRLRQNLILTVVREYWKAVAALKAINGAKEILERTKLQKIVYERQRGFKTISDLQALEAEDRLVEIELDLIRFERVYHAALMELSARMGIPPSNRFEIDIPNVEFEEIYLADVEELKHLALYNRPELYEKDVEDIIALDELNIAALQMFPILQLFMSPNYDSNSFLLFNTWYEIGLNIAYDLFSFPFRAKHRNVVVQERELIRIQRLGTQLAILTQVNLSHLMLKDYVREYEVAREAHRVKSEMARAIRRRADQGQYSEAEALIFESDAFIAEILALEAFASVQASIEQINNSIGLPLYFGASNELSTNTGDETHDD